MDGLSKAGALRGRKLTSGFFVQMADTFPFVENDGYKEFLEELKEYVRQRTPPAGQGTLSRPE